MKSLYPDDLPLGARRVARWLLPPPARQWFAARLWSLAQDWEAWRGRDTCNPRAMQALRGHGAGKTCVVIGNGPSLRDVDFSLLKGVDTFGLNRIYLMRDQNGFVPTWHVVVNDILLEQFSAEIQTVESVLFIPVRHRWRFSRSSDIHAFKVRFDDTLATDITRGVAVGGTVTNVALQLAYYLGYQKVILLGVDHRYVNDGRPNEELTSQSDDPNHFAPNYFGKGVRWNAPDLERSEIGFLQAKHMFEESGRRIVDCTINGALEIFPKSDLKRELS
jgi:Protein of unknown function DUF115